MTEIHTPVPTEGEVPLLLPKDPIPMIQGEVIAIGTAVACKMNSLGKYLEAAMVEAINDCYARGVTDAESILAAKNEALEKAKASFEATLSGT